VGAHALLEVVRIRLDRCTDAAVGRGDLDAARSEARRAESAARELGARLKAYSLLLAALPSGAAGEVLPSMSNGTASTVPLRPLPECESVRGEQRSR
jgi:hypothetical protein